MCCDEPIVENIPGPQGPAGADGNDGIDGQNSFTTITANFIQPAVNATVVVSVLNSEWASLGQDVISESGGYYLVTARPTTTSLTLKNLGYDANAAPGVTIPNGSRLSPAGEKGAAGADGSSAAVPLTTKGDVLGYDSASARVPVGTDGKVLAADAAQALGINYVTVQPNSATDNGVARYDGTTGKPVPLQDSKVVITDDGAVQASGSGGNARGTRAVDLQVQRTVATEVASGQESAIVGGTRNTASGAQSGVLGGNENIASGAKSVVAGGDGNEASGDYSSINGGITNEVSGDNSNVAGGSNNTVQSDNSAIPGGIYGVSDLYGQIAHAAGRFTDSGDAQASELIFRRITTSATPAELFLDGGSQRAVMRNSFSWLFRINVIGRQDNGNTAAWEFTGGLEMNGGVPSLIAAVNANLIGADAGAIAAGWGLVGNVIVTADVANDSLKITVTGAAATNIRWVAHVRLVEVFWPV